MLGKMKDQIKKFLAYQGKIAVTCIQTTELVEEARKTHDLSPVATAAFGRLLTIAAMMANDMKSETDKLTIQIKGTGPLGMMVVTAKARPTLKGYVVNPQLDLPLNDMGKLDVGAAVGREGYINVIKDIGLKDPYIGICPIVSGEIAEDFAEYFAKSEQKNTAVALGVLVDAKGVKSAGGYIITPMPDATNDEITQIEQAIFKAGAISKMLDQNLSLLEIAKKVTGDDNLTPLDTNTNLTYQCDCSKEYMAQGLASIGKQELQTIIEEDGEAELTCQFCHKQYHFTKQELSQIGCLNKVDK